MTQNKVFSVSEITQKIKDYLQGNPELRNIWIQGEISNYSLSGTGHIYFSLKDSNSLIRCTFFAFVNKLYKNLNLKDGVMVQVFGSIKLYEPNGTYSLNVVQIQEVGKGALYEKREKLRRKLHEEGIFDESHKRPLPLVPKRIGIATALQGAAIQDIIKIIRSRNEYVNILIAPCLVQGESAPDSIIAAIQELNHPKWEVDVIIAGRGGGSFEELMAFDHEDVVRAFYNSRVPIVSAVGHEVDSVLSDLAADAYAPTPTAAAEMVTPSTEELFSFLEEFENRLNQSILFKLENSNEKFKAISNKYIFIEPQQILFDRYQKLDTVIKNIELIGKNFLSTKRNSLMKYETLPILMKSKYDHFKNYYKLISERVENFSPLETLKRGYSVVRNSKKTIVRDSKNVKLGEKLEVILSKGKLEVEVKRILE